MKEKWVLVIIHKGKVKREMENKGGQWTRWMTSREKDIKAKKETEQEENIVNSAKHTGMIIRLFSSRNINLSENWVMYKIM